MSTTIRDSLWRVTYQGVLGTQEIFSHGMWVTHDLGDSESDVMTTWNPGMNIVFAADASDTGLGTVSDMFSSEVLYETCTVRPYNATTHLPTADPFTAALATPLVGTGSNPLPYQCAFVITLWDGSTFGKSRYNRFYLPPFDPIVLVAGGLLNDGMMLDLQAGIKAMDTAGQAAANPGEINVYHRHAGTVSGANFVRSDHIIDTQRRRRDQINDNPVSLALT